MPSQAHLDHHGLAYCAHPDMPGHASPGAVELLRISRLFIPDAASDHHGRSTMLNVGLSGRAPRFCRFAKRLGSRLRRPSAGAADEWGGLPHRNRLSAEESGNGYEVNGR